MHFVTAESMARQGALQRCTAPSCLRCTASLCAQHYHDRNRHVHLEKCHSPVQDLHFQQSQWSQWRNDAACVVVHRHGQVVLQAAAESPVSQAAAGASPPSAKYGRFQIL